MDEISTEMMEVIQEFIVEAREMLDRIEPVIIGLAQCDNDELNTETINNIFRILHTIKGTAGFLHFESLQELTHKIENILQNLRDDLHLLSEELVDGIVNGFDLIRLILDQIEIDFQDVGFESQIQEVTKNLITVLGEGTSTPAPVSEGNNLKKRPGFDVSELQIEQQLVLYIDDQTDFHNIVKFTFEMENLKVIGAEDETNGLKLAKEYKPDLILLDIMLPIYGEDGGFEVLKQLKNDPDLKNIPVIMLTARLDHDTVLKALKLGAEDFEKKPFNVEDLLEKVLFCLVRHAENQEGQKRIELDIEKDMAHFTESKMTETFIRRYILKNLFLRTLVDFMKKSSQCHDVEAFLPLTIETATRLGWRCTARLNHLGKSKFHSDTTRSLLGENILKNIYLKYGWFYHNATYGIFMTGNHIFTLMIRNMPEKNVENKESIETICHQAEEFVEIVENQYQLIR